LVRCFGENPEKIFEFTILAFVFASLRLIGAWAGKFEKELSAGLAVFFGS
jgi:hypothetical protein